jgi:phosphohistidine phosphatase SixA
MRLYLVRHGEAEPAADDELRELTPAGRGSVARLAEVCVAAGVRVDEIRHSPLVRARQTAEILAARLQPLHGLREVSGIGPSGDAELAAIELGLLDADVMVVTHMPFVAELEGRLLTGRRGAVASPYRTAEMRALLGTVLTNSPQLKSVPVRWDRLHLG